jgi:RimJ/RimL family protein N-acetyltransferase
MIEFVDLRAANTELQWQVREWRNLPHVRAFFKLERIEKEVHKRWLLGVRSTPPPTIGFLIYWNSQPIGLTYFHSLNYDDKVSDWGIFIHDKELRGKGIGDKSLSFCLAYAQTTLALDTVFLDVKPDNTRALELYQRKGFSVIEDQGDVLRMSISFA